MTALDKSRTKVLMTLTCQRFTAVLLLISWILYHDNSPAHTALSVRDVLATKQLTVLKRPIYSPDLAPVPEGKLNIEKKAF
jgi:hypothetical protein